MNNKVKTLVELGGAGAVLVGLIFVGLELRQNTAAVEAATLQQLTEASLDYLHVMGSDPELTRIWIKGSTNPEQLTEVEAAQLHLLTRGQWLRFQSAFLQWDRGTLSDQDWSLYEGFICRKGLQTSGLGSKGENFRVVTFDDHRVALLDPFVEFVESCWSDN